jgi:hypothetical protein
MSEGHGTKDAVPWPFSAVAAHWSGNAASVIPSRKAAYISGHRGIARMMPVVAVLFRQKIRSERHIARSAQAAGLPAAILLQTKTVDKFQKYFRHKRTPIRLIR